MQGKTPANWFLEVDGQTEGPYTSEEIMKQLMEGALKVESKIFDSAANAWKLAADVIPYLNLSAPAPESTWQPPPKPTELRDVHVVDLNLEATGGVDYFGLISDRKREMERAAIAAKAAEAAAVKAQVRSAAASQPEATGARRFDQTNRALLSQARRAEVAKIVRVSPPIEDARPAQAMREVSPTQNSDGILIREAEESSLLDFVGRAKQLVTSNYKPLAAAAALAFVFVGTYGVIRNLGDRQESRIPAASDSEAEKKREKPRRVVPAASEDRLGTGRNRGASRQFNAASARNAEEQVARVVPPQPEAPSQEPIREEAQFISSRELSEQAEQPPAAPTPFVNQDPNADPNNQASSFVDPPSYIPPSDPGSDPNRAPTNDPNAPDPTR